MAKAAACPSCDVALIAVEKKSAVSAGGLLSVVIALFGLYALLLNPVFGVLLLILAVVIGNLGRGKKTVMKCPSCGATGATL